MTKPVDRRELIMSDETGTNVAKGRFVESQRRNGAMRGSNQRQYFTESELARLISAARKGRYGQRDATLILIIARHGLRVSEAVDLEWSQVDFTRAHLHVRRLKGGTASVHPCR
jgi:type 1 fimbriae regulatory protein FimB/type 1 fimbriae regulatory protein FimE